MKSISLKYILPVVLLALAALMTGCAGADDDMVVAEPEALSGMVSLSFNVDAIDSKSLTNPDGHPWEAGSGGEITIYDGIWLHVYVHDATTGQLMFHFNQSNSSALPSMQIVRNDDGSFSVKVSARNLRLGGKYRLSVMANCQDPYGDLYSAASQFYNTADNTNFLQHPHFMPFSGFKEFTLAADTEPYSTLDIGQMWLLRSIARIDVILDDTMRDKWTIESASLEGVGSQLYCTSYASPAFANVASVQSTDQLTAEQMFNPRREYTMSNPGGDDIAMRDVNASNADKGSYFMIYLPEQDNPVRATGQELRIRLDMRSKLNTATTVAAYLYLRDAYDDSGVPVNLVRNHIYRYRVRAIRPLFDVDVDIIKPETTIINVPSFN